MTRQWKTIWTPNTGFPLELQELPAPAKADLKPGVPPNPMFRLRLNDEVHGAVALVFKEDSLCFVSQLRVAVDQEAELWELPRGMGEKTDTDPVQTAQREVLEETGIETRPVADLGRLWVDSALLKNALSVVVLEAEKETGVHDGEISGIKWMPLADLPAMLARGELCDMISVAALGAWYLAGQPRKK